MTLPWRGTTPEIASEADSRYETPGGAQNKVDESAAEINTKLNLAIITGDSGPEAATARYSTPYEVIYPILKDRLDAADQRFKNMEYFNIKDFGAKGDGLTNDSASIQAAVDSAFSKGGGVVYVPSGVYLIRTMITNKANVSIIGTDKASCIIIADGCNAITSYNNGITISDLTLKTKGTTYSGLILSGDYISVERMSFYPNQNSVDHWDKCIHLMRVWYSSFDRIVMQNGALHTDKVGYGFYIDYSVNNDIISSQMLALNYCVYISNATHPVDGYYCEGWTITQNILIVSNYGIYVLGGTWVDSADNIIDIIQQVAVYYSLAGTGSISGNYVSCIGKCIHISSGDRISIRGNQVSSNEDECIRVDTVSNVISNNTTFGGTIGIHTTMSYNAIVGNSLNLHSAYGIKSDGTYDSIYGNTMGGTSTYRASTLTKTDLDNYSKSQIITFTGGTTQTVNVSLPAGQFYTKPMVCIAQVTGGSPIIGSYDYDNVATTDVNAVVKFIPVGTTNLPNGSIRVSFLFSV